MIVPTRFGLKYAPTPTLALEYEDDLKGVVDATGENVTSLYVYRDGDIVHPVRKLHVVELPMLSRSSETHEITRQLQQDNGRFLSPQVVSEAQLKRLLDRLVENLPAESETEQREPSIATTQEVKTVQKDEESESEVSAMEESVMEESVAEASQSNEHKHSQAEVTTTGTVNPNRGDFVSPESESDREDANEDEAEADTDGVAIDMNNRIGFMKSQDEETGEHDNALAENDESEAEEDAKKTKALRSESDVSEEDVQSEELEYFSEDGSDEDSF